MKKEELDFSAVPCERTGGKEQKLKCTKFHVNIIICLLNHWYSDEALKPPARKVVRAFNFGQVQNLAISPEQSALLDFALSVVLYYTISKESLPTSAVL